MLQRLFKDIVILVLMVLAGGAMISSCLHDSSPILPKGYVLMPGEGIYKVENGQLLPLYYKGPKGVDVNAIP